MCPACIASTVWVIAGATSTGGLTALIVQKLRAKRGARRSTTQAKAKEKSS